MQRKISRWNSTRRPSSALQADEARLQEVIYNLLDNAVKYSLAGRKISVRASGNDGRLIFSVSDNGVGIPARDLLESLSVFIAPTKRVIASWAGPVRAFDRETHRPVTSRKVEAESEIGVARPFASRCRSQPHKRNIKRFCPARTGLRHGRKMELAAPLRRSSSMSVSAIAFGLTEHGIRYSSAATRLLRRRARLDHDFSLP